MAHEHQIKQSKGRGLGLGTYKPHFEDHAYLERAASLFHEHSHDEGTNRPRRSLSLISNLSARSDVLGYYGSVNQQEEDEAEPGVFHPSLGVYALVLMQGAALLFPWNVVVEGVDYFRLVFPQYEAEIGFSLAVSYNVPNFVTLMLQLSLLRGRLDTKQRIQLAYAIYLPVLLLMPVLHVFNNKDVAYDLTLLLVVALGFAASLLQGSLFGLMGRLPSPLYTQALMAGNGLSGIMVSLLRAASAEGDAWNGIGIQEGAAIYFVIAAGIVGFCVVLFLQFAKLPVTQRAFDAEHHAVLSIPEDGDDSQLVDSDPEGNVRISLIARKLASLLASVYLVFLTTLSMFPGMVTSIQKASDQQLNGPFTILLVSAFLWGDFAGRTMSRFVRIKSLTKLLGAIVVRLFITWTLFSMFVGPQPSIRSDQLAFFLCMAHGLGNGWLATQAMMLGPQALAQNERQLGGVMMTAALTAGLVSGSLMGSTLKMLGFMS